MHKILYVGAAIGRPFGIKETFISKREGRPLPYGIMLYKYVDKKRIQSWLNANRLQLPLHNLDLDPNNSVPHNSDLSTQISKKAGKTSRELDSNGNTLTKAQAEFFKDSNIVYP